MSHLVWEPLALQMYHVFSSLAKTSQKTKLQHVRPLVWAPGHPKEGTASLAFNLAQQPDKHQSTEKVKKQHHHHWFTRRGGLGAAHQDWVYLCFFDFCTIGISIHEYKIKEKICTELLETAGNNALMNFRQKTDGQTPLQPKPDFFQVH